MEIVLRCVVPDRPGALAELAGVIGACGGDIGAVDVVDVVGGRALDDLVVVVDGPRHLRLLLDQLADVPDVEVVHAAPSRGHPGDAVTRLAIGLESMLSGAMDADHGITVLLGGLLRADGVHVVDEEDAPLASPTVCVLPYDHRRVVIRRAYAFTRTERERAGALVRTCVVATAQARGGG